MERKNLWKWLGIAGLVGLTLYVYSPGIMAFDSLFQFKEAKSGRLTDFHPPMMAFIWGIFIHHLSWLGGLLALNALLYWYGWFTLANESVRRPFYANLLAASVGLLPPLFSQIGIVWKDSATCAGLLACVAVLYKNEREKKLPNVALAFLFLFYAISMRHNGLPAALPLAFWFACQLPLPRSFRLRGSLGQIAASLAWLVALWGTNTVANKWLVSGVSLPVHTHKQCVMLYDLAGISLNAGELIFPQYQLEGRNITLDTIRPRYNLDNCIHLMSQSWDPPKETLSHFRGFHFTKRFHEELQTLWLRAIVTHPLAYLEHRTEVFSRLIGIIGERPHYPFHVGIDRNDQGLVFEASLGSTLFTAIHKFFRESFFFRAWIYLALSLGLLSVAWSRRRKGGFPALATLTCGVVYMLSFFVATCSADFRYCDWLVASCFAGALILLKREEPVLA